MNSDHGHENEGTSPEWRQLSPRQRRVLGVLIEKAKTTPDAYPLSLNALTNGCNQKSNRSPQMKLSQDETQNAVDELRHMGAVMEVQGSGRVPKYRHQAYEWFAVDKIEIAVLTELMLRGEQTVGELRGRANRMSEIADLAALRLVLNSLLEKRLVISLTPEGRGQVVSHNLYKDRELEGLHQRVSQQTSQQESEPPASSARLINGGGATAAITGDMFQELKLEVAQLQAEIAELRGELQRFGSETVQGSE